MYYGPYSDNLNTFTLLKQIAQIPQNLLLARVNGSVQERQTTPSHNNSAECIVAVREHWRASIGDIVSFQPNSCFFQLLGTLRYN